MLKWLSNLKNDRATARAAGLEVVDGDISRKEAEAIKALTTSLASEETSKKLDELIEIRERKATKSPRASGKESLRRVK